MLSYRHAFHAGNHADVLKHLCLSLVLQKLVQKDKPLCYIDTHAAAGVYRLDDAMALKNREYLGGIQALVDVSSQGLMRPYLDCVNPYLLKNFYPGSPAIAASLLRTEDKLHCFEMHPRDFDSLQQNMSGDRRISCYHRDGLEGALGLSPPTPRRGLMLIDPPYEQALEYDSVAKFIARVHQKWPVGVIALWYPLLAKPRNRAPHLLDRIERSHPKSLFVAQLWVKPQEKESGMHGSGVAFINLPWQVDAQISTVLPELIKSLAGDSGGCSASWRIEPQ